MDSVTSVISHRKGIVVGMIVCIGVCDNIEVLPELRLQSHSFRAHIISRYVNGLLSIMRSIILTSIACLAVI